MFNYLDKKNQRIFEKIEEVSKFKANSADDIKRI